MEIEDRGLTFKSWKSYAEFLKSEVRHLQQFLTEDRVKLAFEGAIKELQVN